MTITTTNPSPISHTPPPTTTTITMAIAADRPLHILVFPWLAFGHMIPFLELSKSLATRGHRVTFLTTPLNLRRLPPVPPHLSPLIHFHPLPLPHSPHLPPTAEATTDLHPSQVPHLKAALDSLAPSIASLLRSLLPDWVIVDVIQYWLPSIANQLSIPCAWFSIFSASMQVFLGPVNALKNHHLTAEKLTAPPDWVPFPTTVAYRRHEANSIIGLYTDTTFGITDGARLATILEGCQLIGFRSCVEFESEWLALLRNIYEKPVVAVGLLPPAVEEREGDYDDKDEIFEWLSKQKRGSVLYVALGSEAALSVELIHELALGLEQAGLPCIWALRRPAGLGQDEDFLPVGFVGRARAGDVVRVIMGWVPQLRVLAHESVGGFLTHCGWSSIIEGLGVGLPMVLLPIFVDQGLNARVMVEKKVGVEVDRREEDGFFTREAVVRAVRLVMAEEEGEVLRANAKELSTVFRDKARHERYMDDFVQHLKDHRGDRGSISSN